MAPGLRAHNGGTTKVRCDGRHIWTVRDVRTGNMRDVAYDDMIAEGLDNFRVPAVDGRHWFRVRSSKEVRPQPVQCIRVDSRDHLYSLEHRILTHNTGGGKSVLQRNVLFGAISHSDEVKLLGIDLKQVELSGYTIFSDAVLGIATNLEDAVEVLRYGSDTMNKRYTTMKKLGFNDFKNIPNHGPAIIIMIDEAGQLLDATGGSSEAAKAEGELRDEASSLIRSIARLGRAAGVHLVVATQRPDAKMIPGELKENLAFRVGCGHLTSIASSMVFDDAMIGGRIPHDPKGRAAVMTVGTKPIPTQVYFTQDYKWLVDWMKRHGKNPDNTPIETGPSVDGATGGIDAIRGKGDVDSTLGIDNESEVEAEVRRRQEAARRHEEAVRRMKAGEGGAADDDDDGIDVDDEDSLDIPGAESPDSATPTAISPDDDSDEDEDDDEDDDDGTSSVGGLATLKLKGDKADDKPDPREDWDADMDSIIGDD